MKLNNKIIILAMLVMMIACVSAVSATDIESADDAIVTDDVAVDEVSDVVEEAEIDNVDLGAVNEVETDDAQKDIVEEQQQNPVTTGTINGQPWENFVFNTTGYLKTSNDLTFSGDFYAQPFGNFKVDKSITINAADATFHNIGFDLPSSQITINGGTFIFNESTAVNSVIYDLGSENTIQNTVMNITAPENNDFWAINLNQPNGAVVFNNTIYYVCNYDNNASYNYVIKVEKGARVKVMENNITAILPMKTVVYENHTGIYRDFVAGIAVTESNYFNLTGNTLDITGNRRAGSFPTLDAVVIFESNWATIEDNTIIEKDTKSRANQYSYIYGIDVYSCNNIKINNNTVTMNADKSGGQVGGNGTGAAYCIQLSGPHTGVVISNNNLTTKNNGPNLGIYSQNYYGETSLTIFGNTIDVTGKAGDDPWSLVSGMELQDNYANVSGNTITVNTIGEFNPSNYVFGISYVQTTSGTHRFDITNNTVNVADGNYSVYLIDSVNSNVIGNKLVANSQTGNSAVYVVPNQNNNVTNNY